MSLQLKYYLTLMLKFGKDIYMAKGDLNEKQACFAREYVKDLNGTQAAIRAGYSKKTAESQASTLLRNPKVKAFVQELMDKRANKAQISAEQVLAEFIKIGFANIRDFVEITEKGNITVNDIQKLSPELTACISEISQTETPAGTNIKFKLYDKLKALEGLGRHLKLFTDKVQHTGNIKVVMEDYSEDDD